MSVIKLFCYNNNYSSIHWNTTLEQYTVPVYDVLMKNRTYKTIQVGLWIGISKRTLAKDIILPKVRISGLENFESKKINILKNIDKYPKKKSTLAKY